MHAKPQPPQAERRLFRRRKENNPTEARLENSQRIAQIGDWDHDFVHDRLIWSEEIYRILGLMRKDCPPDAAAFYRLVHPDDLAFVHREKKFALTGSSAVNFVHRIIRPDGEVRYIQQIVEMTLNPLGQPLRESGTLQDITARKRAELNLRQSEQRFAGAFEHAPIGMALVAPDGRWLMVNRALCDLLGYTEAELLSRTFQDITHPEDLALDLENVRCLSAGDIRSYQMEKRYIKATGQVVTALLDVSLVRDSSGQPSYFVSHIQDITARKQTEGTLLGEQALLNSLISTIPDHIYIKDRQGRFLRINHSMAQRIGLRDPQGAVGKSDMDYFTAEHAQPAYQQEQKLMESGEPIISLEEKETWTDGLVTWASTTKVPLRNPAGEIVGLIGVSRDITARKQAETAMRQQQIEQRALFDLIPAMLWFKDTQNRILRVNQRVAESAGKTIAEIEGKLSQDIYTQEATSFHADDLAVIRTKTPKLGYVETVTDRAGKKLWVQTDKVPVCDSAGKVTGVIVMAQDITARRQAEEESQTAKKHLRDLIDGLGASMMVGLMTPDGILVEANAPALVAVGLKAEDVLGKPLVDSRWFAYSATVQQQLRDAIERAKQGEASRYDMKLRGVDNREIDVDFALNVVRDEAGKIVFLVPSGNDITERKRAETALRESNEKFNQLADNITDAFWIRSPDLSQVQYVSPAFEKIWGRSVASLQANPHEWVDFILTEDRARVQAAFAALTEGASSLEIEYRILRPTGEVRWVRVRGFRVRNTVDQIISHIGIVTDITESKQVNEHLLQAQKMEALGQFSGGVAHDFNNILAAISGYTELARMQLEGNPTVQEHLGEVIKSANRAADLVRQILTFSRQEAQTRQVLPLQPIVIESMNLMRATIPSTVEIDAVIAADAPNVLADANQVHQVLMNLAINGWHALQNLPGRLQVKLERVAVDAVMAAAQPELRPGCYARLSVSDTGSGMDQATLRRIFEPFFTTKPPGAGTGLGLAVVPGIMDSHDGAITVESQPGEGTVFRLYFPEHLGEATPAAGETGPTPHGQGECVLVVDDEAMLAELGTRILIRLGYTAESATTSAQALELVRTNPARYALVLSDQTMPGMTGLELAGELRDIRPDLPIMLMSGYNLSLTADRVAASGIRNILHKPFTLHTLGTAVQATLRGTIFHDHGSHSPF